MPREVSRAIVLYGRIGTYRVRTASMKKGMPGDFDLWRACATTILAHIVRPWHEAGRVDLFVQSWNPELAMQIDEFWKPAGLLTSVHAHQNQSRAMACRYTRLNYCERTMWALLGMKHALELRTRWLNTANGVAATPHATVLVIRHDVIFSNSLPPVRPLPALLLFCQIVTCSRVRPSERCTPCYEWCKTEWVSIAAASASCSS